MSKVLISLKLIIDFSNLQMNIFSTWGFMEMNMCYYLFPFSIFQLKRLDFMQEVLFHWDYLIWREQEK